MTKPELRRSIAKIGLIVTAVLWGGNHVVIRSVAEQTSPFELVFWRWTISAFVLLVFASVPLWRARAELRSQARSVFVLGFLNCVVFSFAIIAAPFGTTATNVGLIQATAPLWVVLAGSVIFSESSNNRRKIGLLLGFAGTCALILSKQEAASFAAGIRWGDIAALFATLVWAAYSLMLGRGLGSINPVLHFIAIVLAGYALLMPVTIVIIALGFAKNPLVQIPIEIWVSVLYVGLGATLLANLFWNFGVHALGPGPASQFLFLAPLCSIIFSVIWLNEIPTLLGWIGSAAVLTGLICSTSQKRT